MDDNKNLDDYIDRITHSPPKTNISVKTGLNSKKASLDDKKVALNNNSMIFGVKNNSL